MSSSRPAPERPGDALPDAHDFAGWPPHGALRADVECGPLRLSLERLDARAADAVAGLAPVGGPAGDEPVRLEFARAARGPWLSLRPGDRARAASWVEGGGLAWATHHVALLMDSAARRGIVVLTDQDAAETARSVQNALRVACAWRLAIDGTGLLLHASAVAAGPSDPWRAVLFLGESGVGKSTAARLSEPRAVLADDACLVAVPAVPGARPVLGARQLFAEPSFPGRAPRGDATEVAAVFRLRQAEAHAIAPLGTASAAAALVAHAPFLLEGMRPNALELARRIASTVPVAELRFREDPGFWAAIEESLAERSTETT